MAAPISHVNQKEEMTRGIGRWIAKSLFGVGLFGIVLFIAAGRVNWTAGWQYLALVFFIQVLNAVILIPTRPDLIVERSQLREGTKPWDRFLSIGMAFFGPLAIILVAGLDARFGWTAGVTPWLRVVGLLIAGAGSVFATWAMAANPFFSATVRIQTDRGHTVSTGGPYQLIRHPGYLGALVFDAFSPFALGSWWALIPAVLTLAGIIVRTALEDRTLQAELPGYKEYAGRVRRRLIPLIW